jgi:hypothetical protein
MVNGPVRAKARLSRAWPLPSSVTRATRLLPTKKVTVPLGVPAPGATAARRPRPDPDIPPIVEV